MILFGVFWLKLGLFDNPFAVALVELLLNCSKDHLDKLIQMYLNLILSSQNLPFYHPQSRIVVNLPPDKNIPIGKPSSQDNIK